MSASRWIKGGLFSVTRPRIRGRMRVRGLHDPLTIRRDRWGIPIIEANNDEDAWYGLGFCHGQDRGGQLEILWRLVHGTLSQVIGADTLNIDRLARRVGFMDAARRQFVLLPERIQAQLNAFARGVNAGMVDGRGGRAPEFLLLGIKPSRWTGVEAHAIAVMLCFSLASNWDVELVRFKVLLEDGMDAVIALDPPYPEHLPVSAPPGVRAGAAVEHLTRDLTEFGHLLGQGGGSNAWAIAGTRTRSGRPLVANDPHLSPMQPPVWYLCHLRTPTWAAAGASFAGSPGIGSGHNGVGAWGVTAAHADNTDLFIEEVGEDGRSVRQGDAFVACGLRREVIEVKGGADVVEEVLITPRGPIVGPAFAGEHGALSMSATWLASRPNLGLYDFHKSQSFEDFRGTFRHAATSSGCMIYGDHKGHIGWTMAVELPVRRRGHGSLPLPGWVPNVTWEEDPVPFEKMPHIKDPDSGFLSAANNQPAPVSEDPFLGADFLDGYRQARITELLDARDDWDVASTMAMQEDTLSIPWRVLREVVLDHDAQSIDARLAQAMLERWDGHMRATSCAASVFVLTVVKASQQVIQDRAPNAAPWLLGRGATDLLPYNLLVTRRISHLVELLREQPEDFLRTTHWAALIEHALSDAIVALRDKHGTNPGRWHWGKVRPLWLTHIFGDRKPLDKIFNIGPIATGGDASTILAASVPFDDPFANAVGVPTLRHVIDVGAWSQSRFVLLGGQSGHPFSPHYTDMIALWSRGEGVPIPWTPEEIDAATQATLHLKPRN